jgi:hypothetical protein
MPSNLTYYTTGSSKLYAKIVISFRSARYESRITQILPPNLYTTGALAIAMVL